MTNTMPNFLRSASIAREKISNDIAPQDFLDGLLLPRGFCTLLATAGGSGKTTAGMNLALNASALGRCNLFGSRSYEKPLKSLVVLGEEASGAIARKLAHELKDGVKLFHDGVASGNLAVIPWMEFVEDQPTPEKVFDEKGSLTESGKKLFSAIRSWKPDFVFFDTISSLSAGDYLQDSTCYNTFPLLNKLAADTDAAIVMTAHVVKGSAGKIDEKSTADDLISLNRGSAAMSNAARHTIVLVPAPPGAFAALEVQEGDDVWLAGFKTNVAPEFAGKTMPVIRSKSHRTFFASTNGKLLSDMHAETDAQTVEYLETVMFHAIRAAAESLQPFAENGKMSPESLAADLLMPVTQGASRAQVAKAVDNLLRKERVKAARSTATGTPLLDVAGGPFANPELHLQDGKPPVFRKGAPDISGLASLIAEAVKEDLEAKEGDRRSRKERKAPW